MAKATRPTAFQQQSGQMEADAKKRALDSIHSRTASAAKGAEQRMGTVRGSPMTYTAGGPSAAAPKSGPPMSAGLRKKIDGYDIGVPKPSRVAATSPQPPRDPMLALGPRLPVVEPTSTAEAQANGINADYIGSNGNAEPMDRRTATVQYGEPGHEFYGGYQRWKMLVGR